MATASELISNQGNANLGLSDVNIPVGTGTDLENLTRIGDQIMYQNMAQNKYLFDQKVKERDKLLSQISSGEIKVGDLLEQDMPIVKEGLDDLDKAWEEMVKKGKNDLGSQNVYKKALREAQDRVTQAQGNKVFYDKENLALSKDTLPRTQEARKKHLEESLNRGFYADKNPYQEAQSLNIDKDILSTRKTISTQYTDPKTFTKGTRTVFDYEKTRDANKDNFLNNENLRNSQKILMREIEALPPQEFVETINSMNNRIREHNQLNNLQPGMPGYAPEMVYEVDPRTSTAKIKESLPDFAAKYTLSREKPFASSTSEFDKGALDIAKFKHDKAVDWEKLGLEKRKLDEADKGDLLAADGILREITDIINKGDKPENQVTVVDKNDNSYKVFKIGEPTILQKFANIDKEGKVVNIPDEARYNPKTNEIDLVYFSKKNGKIEKNKAGGNFIDEVKTLNSRTWANMVSQRTFGGNDRGKVNEIVQSIITKNGGDLYKISKALEGKPQDEAKPDQNYYNDEKNMQSRKGNKITYKDGSVWEISGNEMKKIK